MLTAPPAHAALVLQAEDSTAVLGNSGSFDVNLVDTDLPGSAAYQFSGFNFELSVPAASGVTFTDAGFNTTTPYIFNGNSFDEENGSPLSVDMNGNSPFPTQDFIASDVAADAPYYTAVSPGDTFGLGHISYAVAPGTTLGPVTVSFESIGGGTSLSDPKGMAIPFTTQNGTIIVADVSPTPEPSGAGMLGLMALGLGGLLLRARRRAA